MSSLETTELKLKTTPTGGVSGEHSPYYRRLMSAGYKGFLQGTIGGAGLYGLLGTAVGTLVAVPLALTGIGIPALALIPVMAGAGIMKGANTFGNIGTVAAITAESADLTEQRRYLLDRYYDLPDTPDGNEQAQVIEDMLSKQYSSGHKHNLFHWKTVAICAGIGALLAVAILASPIGAIALGGGALGHVFTTLGTMAESVGLTGAFGTLMAEHGAASIASATVTHAAATGVTTVALSGAAHAAATATGILVGTGIGAAAGATIGLDRYYVRKWFDGSEKLLHDDSHSWNALLERSQQVERIKSAAQVDEQTKLIIERRENLRQEQEPAIPTPTMPKQAVSVVPPSTIASLDKADTPDTHISDATLQHRLAEIQQASRAPTV